MRGSERRIRTAFKPGFTLFEIIVVLAIFGVMASISYPSIMNAFEIRNFDSAARDIMSTMQLAKWQAVNSKLNHRVLFASSGGLWSYRIQVENTSGTWTDVTRFLPKTISTRYAVVVTLPTSSAVSFAPTGFVNAFESAKNQISLTSFKLQSLGSLKRRLIRFYASGSVQYIKDNG